MASGIRPRYANSSHNHDDRYYTESETDTKLNGKANSSHNHDDRYYTESETDTKLNGKANSSHNHAAGDITSGTLATARGGTAGSDSGWANYSNSSYFTGTISYRNVGILKYIVGRIALKNDLSSNSTSLGTLPLHPDKDIYLMAGSLNGACVLRIQTSGAMTFYKPSSVSTWSKSYNVNIVAAFL